jgi:hypothetical protein
VVNPILEDQMAFRDEQKTARLGDGVGFGNLVVQVFTPDVKDGGTDSNVYLYLGGEKFELDTPANDFERGKTDTFVLDVKGTIGALRRSRIILECDGGGWYPGTVTISIRPNRRRSLAETYRTFALYRWLDGGEASVVLQTGLESWDRALVEAPEQDGE